MVRHAKSHCVGRIRRIPLSDASPNPSQIAVMRNEAYTGVNTRGDGASLSPREGLQAQLQTIEISESTPGQSVNEFNQGSNLWDLQNLDFLNDGDPLWAIDNGFAMNGVDIGISGQVHDMNLEAFDYSNGNNDFNGQHLLEDSGLPTPPDMRSIWFTKVQRSDESQYNPCFLAESATASQPTSSPREPEIVDEDCRRHLTRSLVNPFPQENLLPSSGFLVGIYPPLSQTQS